MVVLNTAEADPAMVQDKFSAAYLVSAASRLIQDVAALQAGAQKAKKKLPTFTLETEVRFSSPEQLQAFTDELAKTISKLAAKFHTDKDPNARAYGFHLFSHPVLKKPQHQQ